MGVTKENEGAVPVKCPNCGHRLFDMKRETDGIISIKCEKCKTVLSVSMHNSKYRCRRQVATQA